jgi:TrbL/VirB6 plasmid conjugal transfer protein
MVSLLRRIPRRTLLVLAVIAAIAGAPRAAQAAAVPARTAAVPAQATGQPAHVTARPTASRRNPAHRAAVLLAAQAPDVSGLTARQAASGVTSGGVCQVPGIGDIGGLIGLCAAGTSGLSGDLNNICQPSLPDPEPATAGIDSLVRPPTPAAPVPRTLYNEDGVSGQFWAATNLQCSDMTSLIGNNVAGMVFDVAKSIDRVTITVYQSAAGEGILGWLKNSVDRLITSLGNAIYFPYLAVVVILGAIWLAWQGLIRKRGTRTLEGTIWMIVAAAAAIWLIGRPADFTGIGKTVSDGITQSLNVAFAKLPNPGSGGCVPLQQTDPQAQASFNYTSGNGVVDQNAGELWSVLVCKPWLDGEFGTTSFAAPGGQRTVINTYARQLLWAQTIAANEKPTAALIKAKQATYQGIANSIQRSDPGIYPLFQGKQWTTRLEVAFAALFAAVVAGVLVLLIAVTLILLKLGFLLLLVAGPFFLLIGTHPGFGRVVALRWFELLVGVLLKQAAVALVLSVLLYSYALIMGTSDAVLPWALKILMIALVTIAVFIYRRPFQHLFSAVGYGVIGSRERADADLRRAGSTFRGNTRDAATAAVPGFAAYRAARWARRNPAQAAGVAAVIGAGGAGAAAGRAAAQGTSAGGQDPDAGALVPDASPDPDSAVVAAAAGGADPANGASRPGVAARARSWAASSGGGSGQSAPPLNLPSRDGNGAAPNGSGAAPSGWARNGGEAESGHRVPPARSGSAGYGGPPGRGGGSAAASRQARGDAGPASPAGPAAPAAVSGPAAPGWRPSGGSRQAPRRAPAGPDPAASGGRGAPPPARPAPQARPAPPVRTAPAARPAAAGRAAAAPAPGPGTGPFAGGQAAGGQAADEAAGQQPAPPTPFWLRPIRRQK